MTLSNQMADMEDELILVDIFDRETGHAPKMQTHAEGRLHRAFSVFLYHDDKMLIQQRAFNKYHSGGLWANACCSHPRFGETLSTAVERRLLQELSVKAEAEELFSFVYYSAYSDTMHEYEFDHVFTALFEGDVCPDPAEIHAVKWVSFDELSEDLKNHPEKYSSWFLIACPKVLHYLENGSGKSKDDIL